MNPVGREDRGGTDRVSLSTKEARRVRKRELDRRAQRSARQRTRDRIAELEALLEDSQRKDGKSARIAALLSELAEVKQQRDQVVSVLSTIQKTLQTGFVMGSVIGAAPSPNISSTGVLQMLHERSTPAASTTVSDSEMLNLDLNLSLEPDTDATSENHWTAALPMSCLDSTLMGEPPKAVGSSQLCASTKEHLSNEGGDIILPPPERPCDCIADDDHRQTASYSRQSNVWRSVNKVLSPQSALPADIFAGMYDDDDIAVRAVVEGWEAVTKLGMVDPRWAKLRSVDALCFNSCDRVARLAILHTMYLFMRWDSEPSPSNLQQLPKWYLRRPSQEMAHSRAIDYFVWPGVRERFVFSQHQYCSNRFWQLFSRNLRIVWPREFQDCYNVDSITGNYEISSTFLNQIRNLNCWTMSTDFFHHFPALSSDIPSYQEVPRSLHLSKRAYESPGVHPVEENQELQLSTMDSHIRQDASNNAFWQAVNIIGMNSQTPFPWEMVDDEQIYF